MRVKVQPTGENVENQAQGSIEMTEVGTSGRGQQNGEVQPAKQEPFGCFPWTITILAWIAVVLSFPISLFFVFKVVREYERAVIFRLGRVSSGGQAKGPGLCLVLPFIDTYRKVDLRTVNFDVPPQEILSKDSVTVAVDAVVYYRVQNATRSVTKVEDASRSTKLLAQTTVRQILGTKTLSEMLSEKGNISSLMRQSLNTVTNPWGVEVERIEVRDIRLPESLQRAMASEAEAAREARAGIILAEGEKKASKALALAAKSMHGSSAMQLRFLQTLTTISGRNNHTIMFPLPTDLINRFIGGYSRLKSDESPSRRSKKDESWED